MLNMVGNRTQCLFREMWYQILNLFTTYPNKLGQSNILTLLEATGRLWYII